jgi:hypothetical protein
LLDLAETKNPSNCSRGNIDKFNIMYKYSIYSYLQLLVIHIRIVRIYSVFGEEAAALTLQDLHQSFNFGGLFALIHVSLSLRAHLFECRLVTRVQSDGANGRVSVEAEVTRFDLQEVQPRQHSLVNGIAVGANINDLTEK